MTERKTVTVDAPIDLSIFGLAYETIADDIPMPSLSAALAVVADYQRTYGQFKFRIVHRDTATTLASGQCSILPDDPDDTRSRHRAD